jgi:S-adenosylhomocysteine hydrolase
MDSDLTGKVAFSFGDVGGAIAKALAVSGVEVAVSYVGDADRANATVNGSTAEELEH